MNGALFRLVIVVSFAHALVHVYELALPSVEQLIGQEYDVGPDITGTMGTIWRLPFGFGALLAGWLADRYGAKPLLITYLLGCAFTSILAWVSPTLSLEFVVMFAMGCFASIYHPAGLALISRESTPETRGPALGWHGIFGSIGIACAPLLASIVFIFPSMDWRDYYLLLAIPGLVVAFLLKWGLKESHPRNGKNLVAETASTTPEKEEKVKTSSLSASVDDSDHVRWTEYFLLVLAGTLFGFLYAALMHFLPRYLSTTGLRPEEWSDRSFRNLLTALVLFCGALGQAWAGSIAKPDRLSWLFPAILFANVPCLLWMAFADGPWRLAATGVTAFVHFMNQPIYNSLIARYIPNARRSVGYGFSNMMCFGIGSLGPGTIGLLLAFSATSYKDEWTYSLLALVALIGFIVSFILWTRGREGIPLKNHRGGPRQKSELSVRK
ncbi:L-galactonate transporter [Planctomycetales bacterium 10988]|nr:L-galactonate transporter [Planctomycetales bacterium 10988]